MLKILYGLDDSGRDDFAYEQIRAAAERGGNSWILVPEQFSLSTERSVIQKFGIAAQKKVKVLTFSRLCNLVLSAMGPLRMQYIDGAGKQIIAARTIRALHGKLKTLSPSLKRRGFSSEIVNLVSEFKRYGVSADMLGAAADSRDGELADKLKDISLIFDVFNNFLEKQAADAEDNLAIICPKIKDCNLLNGTLYIMHFRSFTPVEYKALGELMRRMNVCAVVCCDDIYKCSPLFAPVAAACRTLEETAEAVGAECVSPIGFETYESTAELAHLKHSYFMPRPSIRKSDTSEVKIFTLSNNYREVEAAADLIIRLCREEGRRFSDFLILARNTETYTRIMPAIFESRGIDIFLDTRRSILTKPPAEMLCAALDIMSYGYSYDRIMMIARSGMADIPDGDIDIFENYLLAVNPSHAMWAQEEWTHSPKGYDMETVNRVRRELTKFPKTLEAALSGRKTAGQICSALLSCLNESNTAEHTENICRRFAEDGMPYLADEYRQVWNSIISVISQISVLMDDENITWKDFTELFRNACGGISVGLTPQTQGSVVFSPIDKFRSSDTPIVIVLGMTEGVFPLSHTAEGLLSDADRDELLKAGIQLAPGADAKRHEEQLLIHSVLSAAKERLYLFTPSADSSGAQLEPSPIIKRIQSRIFPDIIPVNPDSCGDLLCCAEGKTAAFEVLCSELAAVGGDSNRLCGAAQELYRYFTDCIEYGGKLAEISAAMAAKEPSKLSREAVEAIYGKTIMLSASKLEKYNACAFAYFMSYGLLADERERAGIEPRSTGSIQHAALYRYFTQLTKSGTDYADITRDECFSGIAAIVKDEAIKSSELLYESSSYYKYVVTRMQGIAARTAWEVIKFYKSSRFRPYGFEIRIDTGGDIPAVEITDDLGKKIAVVRGIIDRADTAVIDGKTYVSVVDYKSSQKNLDERLAAAGVNIQPLLYSDIICRRLNASPAAMLYMQMTDPIVEESKLKAVTDSEIERAANGKVSFGGWLADTASVAASYSSGGEHGEKYIPSGKSALVSEEELHRRIDAANKKIQEAANGIYNGIVSPEPYSDKGYDACQYCIYSQSCGKYM